MGPWAVPFPVELVIEGTPVALGSHGGKTTLAAEPGGRFGMMCPNDPGLIGPVRLFLAA